MSGYVPKHSRSNATPSDTKPKPKEEVANKASLADDSFFNEILDADKAVREHPELANPSISKSVMPSVHADPSVVTIRKRRWPVTAMLVFVIVLLGGLATYYVLTTQATERSENRAAAYALLDEAIALIDESNQVVNPLVGVLGSDISEAYPLEHQALLNNVSTALDSLTTAEEKAREAESLLSLEEDKTFAQHVIDAATNRRDMLTSGSSLVETSIQAAHASASFGQAWDLIINADAELRATTVLSAGGEQEQLVQAIERNNAILPNLQLATERIADAQAAFNEADFSAVTTYIALKTESVYLALEADQAKLEGNTELVATKNIEFALKDAAVVDAATKIPFNPFDIITLAKTVATTEQRALFDTARANIATADEVIQEYAGVETQTAVQ